MHHDPYPYAAAENTSRSNGDAAKNEAGNRSAARKSGRTALVWCSAGSPSGGMERIAISIANGLSGRGWRVVMVAPFTDEPVLRAAIHPDVEFIGHEPDKTTFGVYRTMRFLDQIARERRVDVISAHGSLFPLICTRTPVVWTEHDIRYGGSMLRGFRGFAWRWIRYRVRSGSWRVVTVSRYVRSRLRENLNMTEEPQVIYNGLPNAAELRALPPPRMVPPFQIGFLGRLAPIKRPLEVFDLSARLNRLGIPHDWNVFGDGELMPQMRAAAAKQSGHSVRICGLAKNPQDAIAQMDLLCFLSRGEQEGLGMVLLEAMAAQRAIVAWNTGCIAEVLAGRGTLVPLPFSMERFADAIATVLRTAAKVPRDDDGRWDEARMISEYDVVLSSAIAGKDSMSRTTGGL